MHGSSPRAWGIRFQWHRVPRLDRFIPTCVGNTMMNLAEALGMTVHPHVRGEYESHARDGQPQPGSSPRAWGIRYLPQRGKDALRFIPTCVGNTRFRCHCIYSGYGSSPRAWGIPGAGEQPRVAARFIPTCVGNTRGPGNPGSHTFGSSPRAWGIHIIFSTTIRARRFIPTCVGNTPAAQGWCRGRPVHPHVRGEYRTDRGRIGRPRGSSPRAWGIPFQKT